MSDPRHLVVSGAPEGFDARLILSEMEERGGAVVHMAHQVVVKNIAKCEFVLGLAALLVDAIAVESFQHIQEKLAELWVNLETMKALLRAAEADAALDEWGVVRPAWSPLDAARNLFPRLYPRMVEVLGQQEADHFVENWRSMVVVCVNGDVFQGYYRGRKPGGPG